MAKRKKKQSRPTVAATPAAKAASGFSLSRRTVTKMALLLGCATTAGAAIHFYDQGNRELHDLSVIGSGVPVVLQVHDPSCALCRKLKSATERALEELPGVNYRIADLTTPAGREIGEKYNVGKVTLLLFDARGKHVDTIQGVTPVDELLRSFRREFKIESTA